MPGDPHIDMVSEEPSLRGRVRAKTSKAVEAPSSVDDRYVSTDVVGLRKAKVEYDPRYWVIHGKSYDFTKFLDRHPGGAYILQLGKGRDCTELFESVHAFAEDGMESQKLVMAKYEVADVPLKPDMFAWKEDGFYNTLKTRVRDRFKGRNYKATWAVVAKLVIMAVLYVYCWAQAAWTGNWWWAVGSGILTEMIGFCFMHDSSHNAVSKRPAVNYAGCMWSSWMFWNAWLWLQHHVYGHHSYTGIYAKDPDVHNVELFVRKHPSMKMTKMYKYQAWYSWLLYLVLPNQHVGQILLYQLFPVMKNKIFGACPMIRGPDYMERDSRIVMAISFVWHILFPLYYQSWTTVLVLLFFNYTLMGISYFLNVAPNHDTKSTLDNHPKTNEAIDWGEHQVRTTGNHSVKGDLIGTIVTSLWGGMNYQVEHHLFPSLNHAHYHEVSKIVQDTCKEFGIPYNAEATWIGSLKS
eukprot:CAMPEP_0114624322 /NCGR_PEP_ID=MMETSP0168-20121206/10708_1 /TAXON_ID=95228 ORGANISM="Vannella sp., Strain DIVA3 517/6/12" /NCGR_SAMPLE_ID=MMETSP0168 /ASSEMBLY_ACC=CAM_ASM_000044 /LENGTH=463 /DNA_ID=CAMNT_0001835595 /DNA_START=36 /DNA_END=1424 /DNA_ORIENTATION=-